MGLYTRVGGGRDVNGGPKSCLKCETFEKDHLGSCFPIFFNLFTILTGLYSKVDDSPNHWRGNECSSSGPRPLPLTEQAVSNLLREISNLIL
jgi:hypothetical protein